MASASVLAELAEGMDVGSFTAVIDNFRDVLRSRGKLAADPEILGDASAFEGVSKYAARVKCAMISWVAAEDALAQATAPSTGTQPAQTARRPARAPALAGLRPGWGRA